MALPTPGEVLGKKKKSGLPSPEEIFSSNKRTGLPTPDEVLVTNKPTPYTGVTIDGKRISGVQAVRDWQARQPQAQPSAAPATPSYRERVGQELSTFPHIVRPLVAPAVALSQAPFMIATRQSTGAATPEEKQMQITGASKKIGEALPILMQPGAVPGAGFASNVVSRTTGALINKFAPQLSRSMPGRIAKTAGSLGAEGAVLGAGEELARTGDPMKAIEAIPYGYAGGAILGTLGRGAVEGATKLRKGKPASRELTATPPAAAPGGPGSQPSSRATNPGERAFVQTLEQSGKLSDDVQQGLKQSPERTYQPITNVDTVSKANQRISQGIDQAESYVMSGKKADAEQITTGMRLIQELQKSGQVGRAVTIAENLSKKLTEAGQTVQAASIWDRLSPEGALLAAQRKVASINKDASKFAKPIEVTEKNATDIMDAAAAIQRTGASRDRAAQVMDMMDRVKKGEQLTANEQTVVDDFLKDLQSFAKPKTPRAPRAPRMPRELKDKRVRDRVVSFFDDAENAARERMKARGNRINSTPLDEWGDMAIIAASKMTKGAVRFADWSEQMVRDLGEGVRPHLNDLYERAQDLITQNTRKISEQTVSRAERIAEGYLRKNQGTLKPQDAEFIRNMARNVSELSGEAKKQASMDLQAVMNSFERAGLGRKISTVQYISMLLNPVTQVRNIVGNEIMYRLERISRIAATPIDMAVSAATGKPRQLTSVSGPVSWQNFFAPLRDYSRGLATGSRAGWRGVNPEGLTTAYDISGQSFKSKLNPITYLEKTLGAVMKGFDYASYNRAVNQRLREMANLDAINKGIKGRQNIQQHIDKYMANLDENIAAVAKEYGKYVTFQDDTLLSTALQKGKRWANRLSTVGLSQEFGAGNLVLPFAKTPANLLMRALDYSPAGFGRAVFQTAEIIGKKETDLTRGDVIQSVTRALFGTGLGGVGVWLADKGVMRGESAGDRDVRSLERRAGLSQYQLNASALQRMIGSLVAGNLDDVDKAAELQPGDVLYQYEWAQPTSIPLAIGANISQEKQKGNAEAPNRFKQALDVTTGGINTLFNTSLLRGLQQAFTVMPGEENKVKAMAINIIKQAPSMFVPSVVGRTNMLMDDAEREYHSPDFLENVLNPARSRIPGLAQALPERVDTLGEPVKRENNFFDVFLSPAQRSEFKPSENAQFVLDLLSETGDERIAPRMVAKYITGKDRTTREQKKIDLTGEQYVKYQTIVGQEAARLIDRINPNLSTERKIKKVLEALDKAGEKGRKEMRKELGLR